MEAYNLLANLPAEPGTLVGVFNHGGEGLMLLHGDDGLLASFPFVNVANILVSWHHDYLAGH